MLLALDVGNTNVKLGVLQRGALVATARAATRPTLDAADADRVLTGLANEVGTAMSAAEGLVIVSVVPPWTRLARAVADRHGVPAVEATAANIPIAVRVDDPGSVGPDRLVNAFAARNLYGAPAVVVDLGTATTFDAVAADGAYVGGAIAPGVRLGLDALAAHTAALPRVEPDLPDRAIATDTVGAIRSGAVLGYSGLIRELIERISAELSAPPGSRPPCTIATGGLSNLPWVRGVAGVDHVDPDLTLRGLALLAEHASVQAGA